MAKLRAGECYGIPLKGHNGVVVVARVGKRGVLFGYFFQMADGKALSDLHPDDSRMRCRFSDLGIKECKWMPIGNMPGFTPESWPLPGFLSIDVMEPSNRAVRTYDEETLEFVSERAFTPTDPEDLPFDGFYGHIAAEIGLKACITSGKRPQGSQVKFV